MLQINHIREQKDQVIAALNKKRFKNAADAVEALLKADQERRELQAQLDKTLASINQLSREIGEMMKSGKKEEAESLKSNTATLKESSKILSSQLEEASARLYEVLITLPNTPHESVPEGAGPEQNVEVFKHEAIVNIPSGAVPHWDLIREYDIIDFELGNKISGAGFPVYKGKGARLQRALINFFLDEAVKAGYSEVQPPIVVNAESGFGTGQLPDKEGQMYHCKEDDLYLIPTAEVPITNIYRDTIQKLGDLPIKIAGYTPCFRREAGSWGAHVRGLNRLHQFDKVEIVQIAPPELSYKILEEMVEHVKGLLKALELPFRIVKLCGGDMGFASALTYDFEVYAAAQKMWLEVSSVSNFETFQANRLKLRYKPDDKNTILLHTLNGSAMALPRVVAALLENNQRTGRIKMPQALHPYLGFEYISHD